MMKFICMVQTMPCLVSIWEGEIRVFSTDPFREGAMEPIRSAEHCLVLYKRHMWPLGVIKGLAWRGFCEQFIPDLILIHRTLLNRTPLIP